MNIFKSLDTAYKACIILSVAQNKARPGLTGNGRSLINKYRTEGTPPHNELCNRAAMRPGLELSFEGKHKDFNKVKSLITSLRLADVANTKTGNASIGFWCLKLCWEDLRNR